MWLTAATLLWSIPCCFYFFRNQGTCPDCGCREVEQCLPTRVKCPNTVLWCQCQARQKGRGLQQVKLRDPVFPKRCSRPPFRQWHPTGACLPGKKRCTIPYGTWRKLEQPDLCACLRFGVRVTLLCHRWRQKKPKERGKAEVRLLCVLLNSKQSMVGEMGKKVFSLCFL